MKTKQFKDSYQTPEFTILNIQESQCLCASSNVQGGSFEGFTYDDYSNYFNS